MARTLRDLQRDIMLQSIYPSKSESLRPLFVQQALCQARSDVLMSLLFGGRIVTSAGAFFDSDIAVRIFGELLGHKDFGKISRDRSWQPLVLNTDLFEPVTPLRFVLERWRRPEARFGFFREFETGADRPPHEPHPVRSRLVEFLESGSDRFGDLDAAMADLWKPHYVLNADLPYVTPRVTTHPAVLCEGSGFWLRDIFRYLERAGNFRSRNDSPKPGALELFSPATFIARRTRKLTDPDLIAELKPRNRAFIRKLAGRRVMNAFHIEGPKIYGHNYELISHWVETEWHAVRHVMYGSATLHLSSGRLRKDLLDRDPNQRVAHFHPMTIAEEPGAAPDSVAFADFDWSLLFGIVDSSRWHNLLENVREGDDHDAAVRKMYDFIAGKMTDFSFDEKNGRVQVVSRKADRALGYAGLATVFHSDLFGLAGVMKSVGPIAKNMTVPAFRTAHELYLERQLRKAVVPRILMS